MKQVKCLFGGKEYSTGGWTHGQAQRILDLCACDSLNYFSRAFFSGFPLISHFDLPGSVFIFVSSQEPPMYACLYLSQDGF